MSKLNLKEMITDRLWVDPDHAMYVDRNGPFFMAHTVSKNFSKSFETLDEAESHLEKQLTPTLEDEDQEWIDAAYSCVATSYNDGQKVGRREGIRHERERVSALLNNQNISNEESLYKIRKHLGLDEAP